MITLLVVIITALFVIAASPNGHDSNQIDFSAYPAITLTNANSQIRFFGESGEKWAVGSTGAVGDDFIIHDIPQNAAKFSINADSGVVYIPGQLGVGVSSPAERLVISGNMVLEGPRQVTISSTSESDRPGGAWTGGGGISMQGDPGGWTFGTHAFGSSNTFLGTIGFQGSGDTLDNIFMGREGINKQLIIKTATGYVGIGEPNPQATLHVTGDILTTRGGPVTGVKWTPLPKGNSLGSLPSSSSSAVFTIPSSVPTSAKEVLVYTFLRSGAVSPNNKKREFRIFTKEGSTEYSKYFYVYFYPPQNAISYNSENMWLPLTPERKVRVVATGVTSTQNVVSRVHVIGYR